MGTLEIYLFIIMKIFLILLIFLVGNMLTRFLFNPFNGWILGFMIPSFTVYIDDELVSSIVPHWWMYIFIFSSLFFMLGSFTIFLSYKEIRLLRYKNEINISGIWSENFLRQSIYYLFILSVLGFLVNIFNAYNNLGTINPLAVNTRTWELTFGGVSPIFNYLYFICGVVFFLSGMYKNVYGRKINIILIRYISFTMTFFHGIKSTIIAVFIIDYIFTLLIVYFLRNGNPKYIYRLLLSGTLKIFIIVSIAFAYVTFGRFGYFEVSTIVNVMFAYINYNYINLQLQIQKGEIFTYGLSTFGVICSVIHFFITLEKPRWELFGINPELVLLDERYNVGTILRTFVIDFGAIGICIGSFIIGLVSTLFYAILIKRKNILSAFTYSVIFSQLLASFFLGEFIRIQFVYWIIIFVILNEIWKIKNKRNEETKNCFV